MNPILKPISVVLKEARKNKGVSLEEAYKATKVHPNILRSLEDGAVLQLSEVYIKGYIKIYARYLDISDAELGQYLRPAPSSKEKKEKKIVGELFLKTARDKIKNSAGPASVWRFIALVRFHFPLLRQLSLIALIIIGIVFIGRFVSHGRKGTVPTKAQQTQQARKAVTQAKSVKQVTSEKQTKSEKPTKPAQEAAATKENVKQPPAPVVPDTLRLTMFAEADTWVQVKQDGRVVFRGTLKKLSSETWQANEGFELRINDAGAVKLELNGKILSPLGRKGQPLSKVMITKKEGLRVSR